MKKIYLLIISIILFIPSVSANSIENINMDILIDNNGIAHVTEVWNATLESGTEGYKPYYNLGESEISNFKVSMNNIDYSFENNWNVDGSFNKKKYKNGFNYINDGIELCFGISRYGSNTYKLTYDISNFVVNTSDNYQMIYWTLFPHNYNQSPSNVNIKIRSNYFNGLEVWGYGKGGMPINYKNNVIEIDSNGKVSSSDYITVLVKLPANTFNSGVTLDKTFNEYLDMANNGAVHYDSDTSIDNIISIIFFSITFITAVLVPIIAGIYIPKYGTYKIEKEKIKTKDVDYFRDIPYKKEELSLGYWYACQYNGVKNYTDFLGAIFLKWIKMGNITLEKKNIKYLLKDKEESVIKLNSCINLNIEEVELYQMIYEASKDGVLEKKEFTIWCQKNHKKIMKWFKNIIDKETEKLIREGKLLQIKKKKCKTTEIVDNEAKKILGLKKFLNNFSNIKDRSAIEVSLWEEYLMYAYIFGIAKKVMKELKNIYPEIITEEVYNDFNFIYLMSYSGMNIATSSSSGGGGGSFGGGGGGGGFR